MIHIYMMFVSDRQAEMFSYPIRLIAERQLMVSRWWLETFRSCGYRCMETPLERQDYKLGVSKRPTLGGKLKDTDIMMDFTLNMT